MKYRKSIRECPRGNKVCVKTCYGEQCLTCKYEGQECCQEYCIFTAGSVVTKVQTGEVDARPIIDEMLR